LHVNVNAAGRTSIVSFALPVNAGVELSMAEIENENAVPAVVGVPVIATEVSVSEVKFKPGGSAPELEKVYGAVPPLALQLAPVYATPTCAPGGRVQETTTWAFARTSDKVKNSNENERIRKRSFSWNMSCRFRKKN
jgi:hypothetical protein